MGRRFDHIDLRVPDLAAVTSFYEAFLPALGFTRRLAIEHWLQFECPQTGEFFGVTGSASHRVGETRIAFRAESTAEVERLATAALAAGARAMEGPMQYEPNYFAAFFEDPCGTRLEVCFRYAQM